MKPAPIPIHLRTVGILLVLFLLMSLILIQANAQTGGTFNLRRWTVANSGATFSTGGSYRLGGTIGQYDAGTLSGGTFSVRGGFWSVAPERWAIYLPIVLR